MIKITNLVTIVNEETLTGRPHATSFVQKAASDNENVEAA